MTKRYVCTCNEPDAALATEHRQSCGLQASPKFRNGKLVWSIYSQKLMRKSEAIDELVAMEKEAAGTSAEAEEEQDYPTCPTCHTDAGVDCAECGAIWYNCTCVETKEEWWCRFCGNIFQYDLTVTMDEDELDALMESYFVGSAGTVPATEEKEEEEVKPCSHTPQKTYCWECKVKQEKGEWVKIQSYSGTSYGTNWSKCRHYNKTILLPNGVQVNVSSMQNERKDGDVIPDWGLYLDYGWRPSWRSEHINWPDFGLPKNFEAAAEAILYAYELAQNNWVVEIGCIGGHGRTGTALACMAILGGVPSEEVVQWVHDNHCKEAIESKRQEWFPLWFEAYVNGHEAPPMPEEPTFSSSVCQMKEHFAMLKEGKTKCSRDEKCRYWDEDKKKWDEADEVARKRMVETGFTTSSSSSSTGSQSGKQSFNYEKCHCGDNWFKCKCHSRKEANCKHCKGIKAYEQMKSLAVEHPCAMPQCNTMLLGGTEECPTCGTKYAPEFWQQKLSIEPVIGTACGGFVYMGLERGWVPDNLTKIVESIAKKEQEIKAIKSQMPSPLDNLNLF